jgi:two-component system OmpR family response regulator
VKIFNNALIVDDDRDLCFVLRRVLHDTIENVYCVGTLREGIKLFKGLKPDVVFMDNNLPDGQGVDAIRELKMQIPDSLIILITSDNAQVEATLNGADVFLKKPFTSSSVRDALQTERPPTLWPM